MTKKTPWYPADVKPVRKGWYETQCKCGRTHYWTGSGWMVENGSNMVRWYRRPWRGLTEEVK